MYVSDRPGKHDFELLKRVVLPDGSVLLAAQPGRPTADCLFADVMRDSRTLLKARCALSPCSLDIFTMPMHRASRGLLSCRCFWNEQVYFDELDIHLDRVWGEEAFQFRGAGLLVLMAAACACRCGPQTAAAAASSASSTPRYYSPAALSQLPSPFRLIFTWRLRCSLW